MKKVIVVALLVLMVSMGLFASVDAIVSVKPFFTGNNIPDADFSHNGTRYDWDNKVNPSTWNNLDNSWWMKRQDYWMLAYEKTSFFDFGIDARSGGFRLVARLDLMQDVLPNLQNYSSLSTNIPFIGNLIDLTFPRMGFVEWKSEDDVFFVSAGRRLIKWGPGTYDITISDSQPYLDNIWAEAKIPFSSSSWFFDYTYVMVSPKMWMNYNDTLGEHDVQKTIFGHKFSFFNDNFRVTIAELNNVYGKDPSFLDASPITIWHDNNQDDYSNVFLHLVLEGKIGPVRAFGAFSMDDFDLPHETHSNKPQAMGFGAGLEYHLFDGEGIGEAAFDRRDYTIREETFKVENGLNVGVEYYYLSPLMYNRNGSFNGAGKFTIPSQFISLVGSAYVYEEDAYFLGFKYGPNSSLFRFYAEYTDAPIEASLSAELLTRGAYGIESFYGDRNVLDSMGMENVMAMAGDKTTALLLSGSVSYYLQDAFKIAAGMEWQQDLTHSRSAYKLSLGVCLNPVDVDWNNLF